MQINYNNIADSVNFYKSRRIQYIETPWTVSKDIAAITKPEDKKNDYEIVHNKKVLVASGEQSFLYLSLKGYIPNGIWQTVTPCFRDDLFDLTHVKYFMKNEIFCNDMNITLDNIIETCLEFYNSKLDNKYIKVEQIANTYDINFVYKNKIIELGSYGTRYHDLCSWHYATACAEPRLSHCQNILKNDKRI